MRQEVLRERVERLQVREAEVHREHVVAHLDQVEELKERVPDFHDAMKVAATIKLREDVLDEILRSEKSALVQHHLAKNSEKARELNGLSSARCRRTGVHLRSRGQAFRPPEPEPLAKRQILAFPA